MTAAVAVLAGLAAYLGWLGVDWSDDTSPISRGVAAAAVFDLTATAVIAGIWAVIA